MRNVRRILPLCLLSVATLGFATAPPFAGAQAPPSPPRQQPAGKSADAAAKRSANAEDKKQESATPPNPAQIELLETRVRFEENGDSRKEVHALVHINSELGVRQFARLNFDYNRAFESIDIPLVRITHAGGGTADILPSAITDNPNPAVVDFPAYQDVRVKSVRILGLSPGDALEYRVLTSIAHQPLSPDFWLDHSFDRSGVVSREVFELDLPASRIEIDSSVSSGSALRAVESPPASGRNQKTFHPKKGRVVVSPQTPEKSKEKALQDGLERLIYKWDISSNGGSHASDNPSTKTAEDSDIALSTFGSWSDLIYAMGGSASGPSYSTGDILKLDQMLGGVLEDPHPAKSAYESISKKIKTVDLPFESVLTENRSAFNIVSSGYGSPSEKATVFQMLMYRLRTEKLFFSSEKAPEDQVPRPALLSRLLIEVEDGADSFFLDPSMEVAPFGLLSAKIRGGKALRLDGCAYNESRCWTTIPGDPPFASTQLVNVDALLGGDGALKAKVHYALRGDNELLLRVAFHQTPKDKWKDLATLLAISDGFRGKIDSVSTSDPYATREPFTVDYEITMPKFVDWSKKPVRIPALLPQVALPDPPARPVAGSAVSPIELGTPLDVETSMTLRLPPGTTAQTPTGTSVERDYATFSSKYAVKGSSTTASRHIHFILREVPASRLADYNAFMRAVQNDSAQDFTLDAPLTPPLKP